MTHKKTDQNPVKTITEISDFSKFFCDIYDKNTPHLLIKVQINSASEVIRLSEEHGLMNESLMIKKIEVMLQENFPDGRLVKISFNAFLLVLRGSYAQHEKYLHDFMDNNSPCEVIINNDCYFPRLLVGITPLGKLCGESFSRLEYAIQQAYNSAGRDYWYVIEDSRKFAEYRRNRLGLRIVQQALSSSELGLFAQPIVPLNDGEISNKHEISLRHYHSATDIGKPDKILKYAEFNRISQDIDLYVMSLLCRNFHTIRASSNGRIDTISVNLTGSSFTSARFFGLINDIVTSHNVPKEKIVLEITETVAHHNIANAIKTMEKFKAAGFMLALDDIGIGSGNFHNLRLFPVDYFKIDRLYCEEITDNAETRRYIQLIIDIGKSLGRQIIAEGVPDHKTLDCLTNMGVDYAQSYLTGKPAELIRAPKFDGAPK